ncbi:DUF4355 domain-containing protein [Neobacillus sp. PS3-40]|uniref:DUF4355 domain-containing protein n=1 Tax=Neobacillus sp. PS3-40 TaxID=3070679 RepID=UPI0027E215BE|nr:DUF4355 domain-containing protein [Neobacillus sp. PS3-40]WML44082.1 DUF4355 domain-containing protein [Neobacillus sp. PS3-40]
MELNLEQVQSYLETNKENDDVKTYLGKLSTPNTDGVKGFLESNEDGKKLFQSLSDSKVTQGIDSFKKNNLQKLLDDEIKKRFPEKDEKDIQLENIKAELAKIQSEKVRESLTNKAMKIANEQKLPLDLVEYFIGEDEDKTTSNLTKLKSVFENHIQSMVEEKLKESGTNLKDGTKKTVLTLESIKAMSEEDMLKNWDSVQEFLKNNK